MHELSLARVIVRAVCAHADGGRVTKVDVKVGRLRQVVPRSLEFAFELAAVGTEAEGAELAIEHVPVRVACRACRSQHELDEFPLACATCGSLDVEVVAGEEMLVESVEVEPATRRS